MLARSGKVPLLIPIPVPREKQERDRIPLKLAWKMVAPRLARPYKSTLMRLRHISPRYIHFMTHNWQATIPLSTLR